MSDPLIIEPDAWCEWCGEALPEREERRWNQRFCCRKCGEENKAQLMKEARLALREDRTCRHCGTGFKAKGPANWYCSVSCQVKARYRRKTGRAEDAKASCKKCGTEIPLGSHYCGPTCYVLVLREQYAARKAKRRKAKGKDAPGG